jgi:putative oxidoreductase
VKTLLSNTYLLFVSRIILGVVFIIASIEKIAEPELFASSVQAYRMLPVFLINIFALLIPWLELVSGILLLAGLKLRASSAILLLLLGVFVVAILSAMFRGLSIDCGCFGSMVASPVGWNRVLEDVGLMLLCVHLLFFSEHKQVITT